MSYFIRGGGEAVLRLRPVNRAAPPAARVCECAMRRLECGCCATRLAVHCSNLAQAGIFF
jgi:hypothetical protein